jgi:propionyl-CoA synthetase
LLTLLAGSQEVIQRVRDTIGAVCALRNVLEVPRLPKTRSGKILRGTLRKLARQEPYKVPPTVEDPEVLKQIEGALTQQGWLRPPLS